MKRKKINYTHTLYNTETGFYRGVLKDIRTNRKCSSLIFGGVQIGCLSNKSIHILILTYLILI